MIYNNIQSFIADIDEKLAELRASMTIESANKVTAGSKTSKQAARHRGDIFREKKNYITNYQAQLKEYTEQSEAFANDFNDYTNKIAKSVRKALSPEIKKFDTVQIVVQENTDSYYGCLGYYIRLSYTSPKYDKDKYIPGKLNGHAGYAQGINWALTIFLKAERNLEDNIVDYVVSKNPHITADFLESDDYDTLDAMKKLFVKVDNVDWTRLINEANSNTPVRESYGTTVHPGAYSTVKWDSDIGYYQIERTAGTGVWVKVNIERESSYNRWSDNARNAGVHGEGWIKLNSYTDTYYYFNWLGNWRRYGRDMSDKYSEEQIQNSLDNEIRLKKMYISIDKPINYMTTEELTLDPGEY